MTKFERKKTLARFGGHIKITKHLARSILRRMGFVKRKGTKVVKTLPSKVNNVASEYSVPVSLIMNWDQSGCQLVPGGELTVDERGSKQVQSPEFTKTTGNTFSWNNQIGNFTSPATHI